MPEGRRWRLALHGESTAQLVFPPDTRETVRFAIARADSTAPWYVQLNRTGLRVEPGTRYAPTFRARAEGLRRFAYAVSRPHASWSRLGLYREAELTTEWQAFRDEFVATAREDHARVHFDLGHSDRSVEISGVGSVPL